MKKKILITLSLLLIPFISILLVITFRGIIMPTNEEIVEQLKEIECYKTEAHYIVKNSRVEETEETIQYYSKEDGVRVEFGEELVKVFKDDEIEVTDKTLGSEYVVDKNMDTVHSLAFMKNILSAPIIEGSMKEDQEEWGEVVYIQLDVELFLENDHLNTARIFIDKKKKEPIGVIVYDKEGNITVRIIYENFEKIKEIDDNLL